MGIPLSFSQNHQKSRQEGRGDTAVNKAVEQIPVGFLRRHIHYCIQAKGQVKTES